MKAAIHKDLVYHVLMLPEFERLRTWMYIHLQGEENMKEWFDMPDNNKHYSKIPGEHSYKIDIDGVLHANPAGTNLITNIKRDTKDFMDWIVESHYDERVMAVAAIEAAKVTHWFVDLSTAPHICYGWTNKQHSKFESMIDRYYKKNKEEIHKSIILWDIDKIKGPLDKWALRVVKKNFEKNNAIRTEFANFSKENKDILCGVVIDGVVCNLLSYFDYINRYLIKKKVLSW